MNPVAPKLYPRTHKDTQGGLEFLTNPWLNTAQQSLVFHPWLFNPWLKTIKTTQQYRFEVQPLWSKIPTSKQTAVCNDDQGICKGG